MINECLACEKTFDPDLPQILEQEPEFRVSEEFRTQYCSKACEDSFESYLEHTTKAAQESGLLNNPSTQANTASTAITSSQEHPDVQRILAGFNIKIKEN